MNFSVGDYPRSSLLDERHETVGLLTREIPDVIPHCHVSVAKQPGLKSGGRQSLIINADESLLRT